MFINVDMTCADLTVRAVSFSLRLQKKFFALVNVKQ